MNILITGGAGFIGSCLTRYLINDTSNRILVYDNLTYAGNINSLSPVSSSDRFSFLKADICDGSFVGKAISDFKPDIIMHLAAESHVDRSIDSPAHFIQTNILGTFELLEASLKYWRKLPSETADKFRFIHISTDEVFGTLGSVGLFCEDTPYSPNSPYSASKAGSDHLARSWCCTYGLPTIITNCSNNYGPYQFPEKLIPLMIINAVENRPLPIYGVGQNIRDWLYVEDHVEALILVAREGSVGESYNIGGNNERRNIDIVHSICDILQELKPINGSYRDLIKFVDDRPGHDFRYAIDSSKIQRQLGWRPKENFKSGLRKTILWYLQNKNWWNDIRSGNYRGDRLGAPIKQM